MERLLSPNGCPWDREQTFDTLKAYVLEETHELLEAIDSGSPEKHREELGDVLLQVIFQCALAKQQNRGFDIDDVIAAIRDKLIRRHPHVFGDAEIRDATQQLKQWEKMKAAERSARGERRRVLDGVPPALPALQRAWRLGERAGAAGFDWPSHNEVLEKVREELDEVVEAIAEGDREHAGHEIGDLLFAIAQLARHLRVEPEDRLRNAVNKFARRFAYVEDQLLTRGRTPRESTMEEMETLWAEAKTKATPLE